jgi:hypothetical protein
MKDIPEDLLPPSLLLPFDSDGQAASESFWRQFLEVISDKIAIARWFWRIF